MLKMLKRNEINLMNTEIIKILKAKNDDTRRITEIQKKCVLKTNVKFYPIKIIKEWLKKISQKNILSQLKNTSWYVLVFKNKMAGFCQFSLDKKELYQINIDPAFQNAGLGKILYDFVERKFIEKNKKEISLNSTLNAVNFYKKLGFKPIKEIKFKLNKQSIEMVQMRKKLIHNIKDKSFGIVPVLKVKNKYLFLLIQHVFGHWAFPKGHPKKNENPIDTAKRELYEETGLTNISISENISFEERYSFEQDDKKIEKTVIYFLGFIDKPEINIPDKFKSEILDAKWTTYDEAIKLLTYKETREILKEAKNYLK